jgi:hypothetical protein
VFEEDDGDPTQFINPDLPRARKGEIVAKVGAG